MGIKKYNPYTPSRRQMSGSDFGHFSTASAGHFRLVNQRNYDIL